MKYFVIILFFLLIFMSCDSISVDPKIDSKVMAIADESNLSDSLRSVFYDDAFRLALIHYTQIDSTYLDSIYFSQQSINDFFNGLVHIYNSNTLQRDSVMNLFHIHTWLNPDLQVINLYIDSSATWIHNWIGAYRYTTDYKELDNLMNKYNINILRVDNLNWSKDVKYAVTLFSKERLNTKALAKLFRPLEGVTFAEPRSYAGSGNDIRAYYQENKIIYVFDLGWGDCYAGCTIWHGWMFEVNFEGNVDFIWSKGASTENYPYF